MNLLNIFLNIWCVSYTLYEIVPYWYFIFFSGIVYVSNWLTANTRMTKGIPECNKVASGKQIVVMFRGTFHSTHQFINQQNTSIENYTEHRKEEIANSSVLAAVVNPH